MFKGYHCESGIVIFKITLTVPLKGSTNISAKNSGKGFKNEITCFCAGLKLVIKLLRKLRNLGLSIRTLK